MIYFSFSTDSIIPWIALLNKCSLFIFTQFISHLQRKENSCYIMLKTEQNIVYMVQEFDRKLRSITIASCAPAPLWLLSPNISFYYPDNMISSSICEIDQVIKQIETGQIDIGILPFEYQKDDLCTTHFLQNICRFVFLLSIVFILMTNLHFMI